MPLVQHFQELRVYQIGLEASMRIFEASKAWPAEERYSLTDQIRRSSRAVCANIAEAWSKRRYPTHFVSKLSDADAEVSETLTWLEFASRCGYISSGLFEECSGQCRQISGGLVNMMADPTTWTGPAALRDDKSLYDTGRFD